MATEPDIDHLKSYLNYFKGLENPGYAVLITGDWGSGKTYQVNDALEADNPIYVSFFGIESVENVYLEVLSKSNPEAARGIRFKSAAKDKSAGVSILGFGVTLPVGALATALIDGNVRRKIDSSRIIVLDDLERSSMDEAVILGIINFYVEHCNCRVVVIVNDKKMSYEFIKSKEKIIGQTILVKPKVDEVFDLMVKTFSEDDGKFLRNRSETIRNFFTISTCQSLRVLKRTLDDLVRFRKLFEAAQIETTEKFDSLFHLFLALDIDVRSGALIRSDLYNRYAKSLRKIARELNRGKQSDVDDQEVDRFQVSCEKYVSLVDLSSPLLTDEHLASMIVDGIYDQKAIQEHLNSIAYFAAPKNQPAWLRFMNLDSYTDADVEAAATTMDNQFNSHEIESVGEFLHIVALQFMRSENKFIAVGFDKILQDAKLYLNVWVDSGKFPISEATDDYGTFRGFGGYGFWSSKSYEKEFREVLDHIVTVKARAVILFAKSCGEAVLRLLDSETGKFETELGIGQEGKKVGKYFEIPILISVEPVEFIDKYLSLSLDRRKFVTRLLSNRMWRAKHEAALSDERAWFDELLAAFNDRVLALGNTIAALRLTRSIPVENY